MIWPKLAKIEDLNCLTEYYQYMLDHSILLG